MKTIFLAAIRFYRAFLSPMFPPSCRYVPTCSAYALEAIARYGAAAGSRSSESAAAIRFTREAMTLCRETFPYFSRKRGFDCKRYFCMMNPISS